MAADRRFDLTETRRAPARTSVLIVDDDLTARAATQEVLAADASIHVVGQTDTGHITSLASNVAADVVLIDTDPRGPAGRKLVAAVVTSSARSRVIVLTAVDDPRAMVEALAAGASGYLLKRRGRRRLPHAIHEVMDGRVPLAGDVVGSLRERLGEPAVHAVAAAVEHPLTPRELTVLSLVAEGLTNEKIADDLVLSPGTVKLHVQHIIAKLGVANRTQAAVYAARKGLLPTS